MRLFRILTVMVISAATCAAAEAQTPQRRIALVVGEGAYVGASLPTAVNDAGLIAQALNDSGFEIIEGRDLDLSGLRQVVQDFLRKVEQSGPDTEAAIYFSGYAAQLDGDNFLVPVDARIGRASDLGMAGFRLSDLLRSLNAATNGVKIVIIDAPRGFPALQGKDVAPGMALTNAPRGMLVAYATAPGYVVPEGRAPDETDKDNGNYGIYATALADQIYQPGVEADEVFKRVRLQVHGVTAGIQIPWHNYALAQPFFFSSPQSNAVPLPPRPERVTTPEEAYAIAIESDTISGYQAFLKQYPDHALARRVKVLLANRREAVVWNRTIVKGTAEAYWSYLKAYPRGPHAEDARHRLAMMSRPVLPPEDFRVVIYDDVPPPIEIEQIYETTYIYNDYREYYNYPPPPPPPVYILPPSRPIPWARPTVIPDRPGFLPVPPRPAVLPPPAWRDRPPPPRVAPIAPFMPGRRPAEALPPAGSGPRTDGPPGLPRPPQPGPATGGQERVLPPRPMGAPIVQPDQPRAMPVRPGTQIPVEKPPAMQRVAPQDRARPTERPTPQERVRPVERPTPQVAPQQRTVPQERPAPKVVPQERIRPTERPAPQAVPQERVRPVERPAPQVKPQERTRPVERPAPQAVPQERARPVERPAPQAVPQERARPVERPAPPPVQMRQEPPRQMEQRPSSPPVRQEPPRQMEQRPAPSNPPPAARSPEPQRQEPQRQEPQRPDRRLRPGEQP